MYVCALVSMCLYTPVMLSCHFCEAGAKQYIGMSALQPAPVTGEGPGSHTEAV